MHRRVWRPPPTEGIPGVRRGRRRPPGAARRPRTADELTTHGTSLPPVWRLTVRDGSNVERARFDALDEALLAARAALVALRSAAPRGTARAFARPYEPVQRVAARVELDRGRRGRPRGGIDVRGDGSVE